MSDTKVKYLLLINYFFNNYFIKTLIYSQLQIQNSTYYNTNTVPTDKPHIAVQNGIVDKQITGQSVSNRLDNPVQPLNAV